MTRFATNTGCCRGLPSSQARTMEESDQACHCEDCMLRTSPTLRRSLARSAAPQSSSLGTVGGLSFETLVLGTWWEDGHGRWYGNKQLHHKQPGWHRRNRGEFFP